MKFLIDECLSPSLARIARERGFPESTHATWIGLRSRQDWAVVRRAVADGYVVVTQDTADFSALLERETVHPGLLCMTVAHGLMSLDVQQALFAYALARIADADLTDRVVEVALLADRTVRLDTRPTGPG